MSKSPLEREDLSESRKWFEEACRLSRTHSQEASQALQKYGDHGADISGVVRDHFPGSVKNRLRALATGVTEASDKAWAACPKRVRHTTMRKLSQMVAERDGSGFYGPQP